MPGIGIAVQYGLRALEIGASVTIPLRYPIGPVTGNPLTQLTADYRYSTIYQAVQRESNAYRPKHFFRIEKLPAIDTHDSYDPGSVRITRVSRPHGLRRKDGKPDRRHRSAPQGAWWNKPENNV